jgi:hypothetical protein
MKVDNRIISRNVESNVCGFYALFNALRTAKERLSFAAGDNSIPHDPFIQFINMNSNGMCKERVAVDGYNSSDFGNYLKYLKEKNYIKSYVWKRSKKPWRPSRHLCCREPKENIYLLCGHATVNNLRPKLKVTRTKKMPKPINNHGTKIEACQLFNHWSNHYKGKRWSHGIAVGAVDEGHYYVYDTSRKVRQVFDANCLCNLSWSINRVFAAYIFGITV